ncbi:MAG: YmdB family metallophosphoesterase [Silvanigrellaceae bacterium]|nr:YmdB family metallophosphoesterase [Silvanigrellaceae bacterium]
MNSLVSNTFEEEHFFLEFNQRFLLKNTIKVLMMGDIIGRPGRKILKKLLPRMKKDFDVSFLTVNGENIAGGFGITEKIFLEIRALGVDAVTMGNHWKDKPEIHHMIPKYKELVLPQNLDHVSGIPQFYEFYLESCKKTINVINLMGNYAMGEGYLSPFLVLQNNKQLLAEKVKSGTHIVIADIHAEATSEKQAIAWYFDGILAGLIGTHTHTPTSDERLTSKGTAFLTDVGMTGGFESVVGMETKAVLTRFLTPKIKAPFQVAENDLWLCAFLLEIDPQTCLSVRCHRLQFRENRRLWNTVSVLCPDVA